MLYTLYAKNGKPTSVQIRFISFYLVLTHQLPLVSGIGFIVRILLGLYFPGCLNSSNVSLYKVTLA